MHVKSNKQALIGELGETSCSASSQIYSSLHSLCIITLVIMRLFCYIEIFRPGKGSLLLLMSLFPLLKFLSLERFLYK